MKNSLGGKDDRVFRSVAMEATDMAGATWPVEGGKPGERTTELPDHMQNKVRVFRCSSGTVTLQLRYHLRPRSARTFKTLAARTGIVHADVDPATALAIAEEIRRQALGIVDYYSRVRDWHKKGG